MKKQGLEKRARRQTAKNRKYDGRQATAEQRVTETIWRSSLGIWQAAKY